MSENLMSSDHKATNQPYQDNYDRTFRNKSEQDTDNKEHNKAINQLLFMPYGIIPKD